jgi:hypothetical protein
MYYFELFDAVMFGIIMLLLIAFAVSVTHATMKAKAASAESCMEYWVEEWCKEKKARELAQSSYDYEIDCMTQQHKRDINKAKREHGKKIRKAADRKLERVEREYEAQLAMAAEVILKARTVSKDRLIASANARSELSAFQSIVSQELENFIRLPSVRNACIKAINQQHKAWQEL